MASIYETAIRHRVSPEFIGSRNCVYRWHSLPRVRRHRASKPQGSYERVLPWQVTTDQLIFASLSHNHYWYEVGMLKVPVAVAWYSIIVYCCRYYSKVRARIAVLLAVRTDHDGESFVGVVDSRRYVYTYSSNGTAVVRS